jgi:nucleotide-binding universal stress UspA family protein
VVGGAETQEQVRQAMRETMTRELERVRATGEVRVVDGPPASAITELADSLDAELLVVGTHGRTGFSRLALGSVAERVARAASSSVLVVRTGRAQGA